MRKKSVLWVSVGLALLVGLVGAAAAAQEGDTTVVTGGHPQASTMGKAAVAPQGTPPVSPRSEVESTWGLLTEKWLQQLGNEGWLYLAYKEEYRGDLGTDPETGWPLPNRALREIWFLKDDAGLPTIVLTRRTDLTRGNTWLLSWADGLLVNHTSGVRTADDGWKDFHPIKDLGCVQPPEVAPQVQGFMTAEWKTEASRSLYVVTIHTTYPPISGIYHDSNTYVATDITCVRDGDTGAVVSAEQALTTVDGECVVATRNYDFVVQRVSEPPAGMLALLDQR